MIIGSQTIISCFDLIFSFSWPSLAYEEFREIDTVTSAFENVRKATGLLFGTLAYLETYRKNSFSYYNLKNGMHTETFI